MCFTFFRDSLLAFHDERHPPRASRRLTSKGHEEKRIRDHSLFGAGIVAMLLVLLAVNFIAAQAKNAHRSHRREGLHPFIRTRAILAKLDTPVQIRLYCTKDTKTMPVALATYAQRVEDLLGAYRQASKGKIEIQRLDPAPIPTPRIPRDSMGRSAASPNRRASLSRCERQYARSKAGDPFPYAGTRTSSRVRYLSSHCARHDFGKTSRRGNERAPRHGRYEPHDDDAPATGRREALGLHQRAPA